MPGGPYVVFLLAASLIKQGIGIGPLLAFVTAKVLLSPIRLFTREVPFLGWPFTLARLLPSIVFPPHYWHHWAALVYDFFPLGQLEETALLLCRRLCLCPKLLEPRHYDRLID